jgi:hypothetical protein
MIKRFLLLLGLILATTTVSQVLWGDPRINILGSGWDPLVNEPRQNVFVLVSDKDKQINMSAPIDPSTLAKGVIMVNYPSEDAHIFAEVISTNVNIKDSRDISISGGFAFKKIGGSFSVESKTVKSFISSSSTKVTRVTGSIRTAEISLQTWATNMSEGFTSRIMQIRDFNNKNTTLTVSLANQLADEILNIYGVFVITRADLGGYLTKIDSVDVSTWSNSVDQTLSASGRANFATFFKISGSYVTEHTDTETYSKSIKESWITSQGGLPWSVASAYSTWLSTVDVNPTPISLSASYIVDLVSVEHFSNFSFEEIMGIKRILNNRAEVYLKNNVYTGCSDPTASNYVSYANVFDDSLCNYQSTYHFGGMYTVSDNPRYSTANPLTEDPSCPTGFTAHPLLQMSYDVVSNAYYVCEPHHIIWRMCHGCCIRYVYQTVVSTTYTCLATANMTTGMYFGGMYTTSSSNDITQGQSCPSKYIAFPIFLNADKSSVAYVCMAPYDSGHVTSVPFGGMFSSQYPNYLLDNGEPVCGKGFERHPVGPGPIAELTYCIGVGSLNVETKDVIPPGYGNGMIGNQEMYNIGFYNSELKSGVRVNPYNSTEYNLQAKDIYNIFRLHELNLLPKVMNDVQVPGPGTKLANTDSILPESNSEQINDPDEYESEPESGMGTDSIMWLTVVIIVFACVVCACFFVFLMILIACYKYIKGNAPMSEYQEI